MTKQTDPDRPPRTPQPAPQPKSHSHEERLRYQGKMLDEIMDHKHNDLAKRQAAMPLTSLRALADTAPDPLDFTAALRKPGVSLIAEVKTGQPDPRPAVQGFRPRPTGPPMPTAAHRPSRCSPTVASSRVSSNT